MSTRVSYVVFRTVGKASQRQNRCRRLRDEIIKRNLQQAFPIIRYETGRAGEYFGGVAVDADSFDDEREAARQAEELISNHFSTKTFYLIDDVDGLRRVLRGTVGSGGYSTSLRFEQEDAQAAASRAHELAAAFERGEIADADTTPPSDDRAGASGAGAAAADVVAGAVMTGGRSEAFNRLLYWCTANGCGDVGRFEAAARALGALAEGASPWSLLRRMALLGHIEFAHQPGGWRWSVAPNVAVRPLAGGHAFAAGERTPGSAGGIADAACGAGDSGRVERTAQPDGPDRLACGEWTSTVSANEFARRLPALCDWIAAVPAWDERDFHGYEIERLDRDGRAEPIAAVGEAPHGLHRFRREGRTTHAWFDRDRSRWIAGDALTLRFIDRAAAGAAVAVIAAGSDELLVPRAERWPLPYEKALVLASGLLPALARDASGAAVLRYRGVPAAFAGELCAKLNVKTGETDHA